MNKQLFIARLTALGTSGISYWSFLRGEIIGGAIGAFLSGAPVVAFLYEARDAIKMIS